METVELNGGPFDGRSALNGVGNPPDVLKLWHMPEDGGRNTEDPVGFSVCVYAFKGNGRYEFQRAEKETLSGPSYAILKAGSTAQKTLRKLISDQRLFSVNVSSVLPAPEGAPLPLAEARQLKSTAVRNIRRSRAEAGDAKGANLPEEKLWALICGAALTDLEWAEVGSPLHLRGMLEIATNIFGLQIHPDRCA